MSLFALALRKLDAVIATPVKGLPMHVVNDVIELTDSDIEIVSSDADTHAALDLANAYLRASTGMTYCSDDIAADMALSLACIALNS